MIADIVPVLAAVCELDPVQVNEELYALELELSGGAEPTVRTFCDAVIAFRHEHPFELAALQAGQDAKDAVNARATLAAT